MVLDSAIASLNPNLHNCPRVELHNPTMCLGRVALVCGIGTATFLALSILLGWGCFMTTGVTQNLGVATLLGFINLSVVFFAVAVFACWCCPDSIGNLVTCLLHRTEDRDVSINPPLYHADLSLPHVPSPSSASSFTLHFTTIPIFSAEMPLSMPIAGRSVSDGGGRTRTQQHLQAPPPSPEAAVCTFSHTNAMVFTPHLFSFTSVFW